VTGNFGIHPPQESAVLQLLVYLERTSRVSGIERPERSLLIVHRIEQSTVRTFLTDTYILGTADVFEVLSRHPDINAIVNFSLWNHESPAAREECLAHDVGLFTFREFLGAIHYSGKRFLNYEAPKRQ
jgi:hypothetical protein